LGEKKRKKNENLKEYSKIFQFSAMESSKWININESKCWHFQPKKEKKTLKKQLGEREENKTGNNVEYSRIF
jgi:hypothetical protein